MMTPTIYTACNSLDLHCHFNIPDHQPLPCELCRRANRQPADLRCRDCLSSQTLWYYCPQCGFSGSGVEYLAEMTQKHPATMLRELVRAGEMPRVVTGDVTKYHEYYDNALRIRKQYNECPKWSRLASNPLRAIENLDHYPPAKKYRLGDRPVFERVFHAGVEKHNTSGSRVFHGRNWSRITAIPLYDMPMRMSSVLFINGDETPVAMTAIRRLGPRSRSVYSFDPGWLATSWIIDPQKPPEFVVLSTNWQQVLRFQADIAYQEQAIAPIVGWFPLDPVTGKSMTYRWGFFRDMVKVFWSWPGDLVTLREACLTGGMISHAWFQPRSKRCELPDLLSGAVVRSIGRSAEPWQKALGWHLDDSRDSVEGKLEELKLPPYLLEQFLPWASHHVRRVIQEKYLSSSATVKHVDNFIVSGHRDGWFQVPPDPHAPPILLSSARCLIDRALSIAGQEPMYQGRVLLKDESFSFLESRSVVEKNVVRFIHGVCTDHKSKHLPVITASPEKLLKVVKCHANFQVRYIANGFGWDSESGSLVLPNVTLSDSQCLDSGLQLDVGPLAALKLEHFEPLDRRDMHILATFNEETPYLLAIFVSLLPVIFATAWRMETPQTTVTGWNTDLLQQLFKFLQLPCSLRGMTPALADYAETHSCPYFVKLTSPSAGHKLKNGASWVDSVGLYGCGYVASSLPVILARMTLGHANMLFLPKVRFYRWIKEKLPEVYLKCLAQILKHFSRYVLEPNIQSENWNSDLMEEAVRFFEQALGLPVHKGTLYEGYYDSSSYFCDFVNLMQQYEELKTSTSEDGLLVPVASLGDCYRKTIGMFDFDLIRTMLTRTMLLKQYDPSKHVFLIDQEMFGTSRKRLETIFSSYIR